MKFYKVSEEFLKALRQLVESLPYAQVKGVAVGFDMEQHCEEIKEEVAPEVVE
jgi:hypothetical protein